MTFDEDKSLYFRGKIFRKSKCMQICSAEIAQYYQNCRVNAESVMQAKPFKRSYRIEKATYTASSATLETNSRVSAAETPLSRITGSASQRARTRTASTFSTTGPDSPILPPPAVAQLPALQAQQAPPTVLSLSRRLATTQLPRAILARLLPMAGGAIAMAPMLSMRL